MQGLYGTYRGFAPTEKSRASLVGMGELRVVIDTDYITLLSATGGGVAAEMIPTFDAKEMTSEKVAEKFDECAPLREIRGFSIDRRGIRFFFLPPNGATPRVVVHGLEHEDARERAVLYAPAQVEIGIFEQTVREIEAAMRLPGAIPLLNNHGKAPMYC